MYETHKQADTTKVGNFTYHFIQLEDEFIFLPRQTLRSSEMNLDLWYCIGREKPFFMAEKHKTQSSRWSI